MPTVPFGRVAGETVMTGQILSVYEIVAEQPYRSTALKVSGVPDPLLAVGVPETTPVPLARESPAGSVPDCRDQV